MLLQGNFVKVFVKIKVLKLPEVKCMCTYGVTLPGEHLQVAWWWQRWMTLHPAQSFAGQSSAGLLRLHWYQPPPLLQYFQHPCRGNHTSEFTLGYTCKLNCEPFRIQNSYCDLRVCGAFLRPVILNGSVCDLLIRHEDRLFEGTTDN